jgi:hypothetical protein
LNGGIFVSREPGAYMAATDLRYWTKALPEAERELDAATRRSEVNAAGKRLQRARAELKPLRGCFSQALEATG